MLSKKKWLELVQAREKKEQEDRLAESYAIAKKSFMEAIEAGEIVVRLPNSSKELVQKLKEEFPDFTLVDEHNLPNHYFIR